MQKRYCAFDLGLHGLWRCATGHTAARNGAPGIEYLV
jgi:hypothetical protein